MTDSQVRVAGQELLLEIVRCPVVEWALTDDTRGKDCREVVRWQRKPFEDRFTPEPWSGHLASAAILFLSSNPSSGEPEEVLPLDERIDLGSDKQLVAGYEQAFEPGPWWGIADGIHLRAPNGRIGKAVRYWSWARARAREVLGRTPIPGTDYALTEAVHCGSKREVGVRSALKTCVPRYLNRVLSVSAARLLVCVGDVARTALEQRYPIISAGSPLAPVQIEKRPRIVVSVPHPGRYGTPKRLVPYLGEHGEDKLVEIRRFVAAAVQSA